MIHPDKDCATGINILMDKTYLDINIHRCERYKRQFIKFNHYLDVNGTNILDVRDVMGLNDLHL